MRTQKNYSELELRKIFNIDDEYEINMEQRETLNDYLNVSPFKLIENAGVQLHRNDLNETFIINEQYDLFNSVNSKTFRQYGMVIHASKFDDFVLIGNVSYHTMILISKTGYTIQIGDQPPYKEIRTKTIYSDAIARHIRKFLFDVSNAESPKIDVNGTNITNKTLKTFTCPYEFCAEMLDIDRNILNPEYILDDINILVRAIATNIPDFLKEKYSIDLLKPIGLSHMTIAIVDLLTNYNVEIILEHSNINFDYYKFKIDVNNRLLPQVIKDANQKYLSNKDVYHLDFEIN